MGPKSANDHSQKARARHRLLHTQMTSELLIPIYAFFQPGAVPLQPVMLTIHTKACFLRVSRRPLVAVTDIRISRQARDRTHPYLPPSNIRTSVQAHGCRIACSSARSSTPKLDGETYVLFSTQTVLTFTTAPNKPSECEESFADSDSSSESDLTDLSQDSDGDFERGSRPSEWSYVCIAH
jgi:hypothetical protein